MRALFSPEILLAGAVKGLKTGFTLAQTATYQIQFLFWEFFEFFYFLFFISTVCDQIWTEEQIWGEKYTFNAMFMISMWILRQCQHNQ